jgi:type I restriction enzyme S subunit
MTAIEGWTSKQLSGVLSLILDFRGKTPKKLGMEWGGGDIPALSANNVEMGRINFSKECYFGSDALYRKWMTRGDAQIGDVVLTTEAPLGNVAQIPDERRYILSQRAILLRANDAELCNDYLKHYLTSDLFQTLMRQQSSGTTATGIQRARLETLPINFPISKREQTEIAAILSTVDRAIEQTGALIAKQQHIKTGLMQDLLTLGIDEHGNLRSEQTHAFKDSPLGRIPMEWSTAPMRSVAHGGAQNGYFKKPELVGSGYKLINVSEIYQPFGIDTDLEKVERIAASQNDLKNYGASEGDLFFTRSSLVLGGIAYCNILRQVNEPTLFECHVMRIRPNKSKIVPEFLALFCQSHIARLFLMSRAKHVTMTTISQPELESLNVPVPSSTEEQRAIVNAILSSDAVTRRNEIQRDKLISLKTALMQDLLTGKKRVTPLLEPEMLSK